MVKSYRVRLLSAPSHRLTGDARLGCMLESGTVTFSDVTDRNTASNYVNSHAFKSYRIVQETHQLTMLQKSPPVRQAF
jgi:hypothetical protein